MAGETPRARKPRYLAHVKRVRRLTPRMTRVTFTGEELATFGWNGPAAHIKLIFGDGERPLIRTYTPRRFDPQTGELDVEFVIHGEGPASAWASQADAGQSLTIAGPGRSYAVDPSADWYLLIGDDTAIPALCTILEALPATVKALALIEVADAAEEHALETRSANTEIRWLHRGPDPRHAGRELEAAVRRIELPPGSGRVYVACESDSMRRIRRHLLSERQLARDRLVTRGYWRLGETDHPDRDYGEDIA
ncbi:MAG: siderophore-interacting protein [Steroidobacteraceae bacterium]